jgi:hypothetical protein
VEDIGAGEPDLVFSVTRVVVTDIGKYPTAPHLLKFGHSVGQNVGRLQLFARAHNVYVDYWAWSISLGWQITRNKQDRNDQ